MNPDAGKSVEQIKNDVDFKAKIAEIIGFAVESKRKMLDRGKRRGHRKCPACGGRVNFVLAGNRNHLRMACETDGCHMRMME